MKTYWISELATIVWKDRSFIKRKIDEWLTIYEIEKIKK